LSGRKYRGIEEHMGEYGGSIIPLDKEIAIRDWE
jgi:hypothetical protein